MKRFILFAGSVYYPCSGWEDLAGETLNSTYIPQHNTVGSAVKEGRRISANEKDYFWWHVVDLELGQIIWVGDQEGDKDYRIEI